MIFFVYLLALVWLACAFAWAYPLLNFWLIDLAPQERAWLTVPLVFGVSVGVLSLAVFVTGFWQVSIWSVLGVTILAEASGLIIKDRRLEIRDLLDFKRTKIFTLQNFFFALSLVTFLVVLAHATYYPFIGDDELSRYAYYGKLLWWHAQVTPAVRGYPMLMASMYAAVFALTNPLYQFAEQLAKLVPVFFALTTVWATAALARRWFGRIAGYAAALILICTSLYLRWSPEGYVDIPSALYFVLGAYAADLWREKQNMRWAVLTGAMVGFSLWAKQAGFALLPTLGLIFAWTWWRTKNWRVVRDGLLVLAVAFVCGGWWYARNIFYDGWANVLPTPGTFYTTQAQATLINLIPFLGMPTSFGVAASAVYTVSLVWALVRVRRTFWILLWALPYTLLWWQSFSYDARFLLTVLPFYAVLVGGLMQEVAERLKIRDWRLNSPQSPQEFIFDFFQRVNREMPFRAGGQILVAVVILLVWGVTLREASLGGAGQWVTAPAATYAERLTRVKGDLYPTVEFIRAYVPPPARILSMDGRVSYYLIDRQVDVFYPATVSDLRVYDYVIIGSWWILTYDQLGLSWKEMIALLNSRQILQLVYAGPSNSMQVYRMMKP